MKKLVWIGIFIGLFGIVLSLVKGNYGMAIVIFILTVLLFPKLANSN